MWRVLGIFIFLAGCAEPLPGDLNQKTQASSSSELEADVYPPVVEAGHDAQITAFGGSAPYSYATESVSGSVDSGGHVFTVSAGLVAVEVSDKNGKKVMVTLTVNPAGPPPEQHNPCTTLDGQIVQDGAKINLYATVSVKCPAYPVKVESTCRNGSFAGGLTNGYAASSVQPCIYVLEADGSCPNNPPTLDNSPPAACSNPEYGNKLCIYDYSNVGRNGVPYKRQYRCESP